MFDISDSFMASSKIEISADTDLIFMNFKFKAIKRIYTYMYVCGKGNHFFWSLLVSNFVIKNPLMNKRNYSTLILEIL